MKDFAINLWLRAQLAFAMHVAIPYYHWLKGYRIRKADRLERELEDRR